MPFIAVPTTSGTGSEATLVAVVANPEKHVKMEFISYHLLPDAAVLDVLMTASLPPRDVYKRQVQPELGQQLLGGAGVTELVHHAHALHLAGHALSLIHI